MAKVIETRITIQAPLSQVWAALTDFGAYPQWNPFIRRAAGEVRPGARLKMHLQIPDGLAMKIRPRVLTVIPEEELRWLGSLLVPGLFDGEHCFLLKAVEKGSALLVQQETFRGILVPFFGGMISRGALRGFEAMNRALKQRLEGA